MSDQKKSNSYVDGIFAEYSSVMRKTLNFIEKSSAKTTDQLQNHLKISQQNIDKINKAAASSWGEYATNFRFSLEKLKSESEQNIKNFQSSFSDLYEQDADKANELFRQKASESVALAAAAIKAAQDSILAYIDVVQKKDK